MQAEFETVVTTPTALDEYHPWSEEQARRLAAKRGLGELTDAHWKVIHTLRQHFVLYGALPPMSHACGLNQLDPRCGQTLFQGASEAWQLAGLPEPGSEAVA